MKPRYEKPPYQPKWVLQMQVWMLHRRLIPAFNKQSMVITTTGRKSGRKISVPIDFVRDGSTYLALNVGKHSNWYLNALANPSVTLEIDGSPVKVRAEPIPVETSEQLQPVLDVYRRERPRILESFLGISLNAPVAELMDIGKYVAFVRFSPLP